MTTETLTDKPARAATRGPGFQDILDAFAEMRAENKALRDQVDVLSALVQSALPAALVRLGWESVQDLITGAPQTKVRLLAPFVSPMMNLAAGVEMEACDDRVRKHGRAMVLGLATVKSDAPAMMVKRLISDRAAALVTVSKQHEQAGRLVEAELARAHADKLATLAGV